MARQVGFFLSFYDDDQHCSNGGNNEYEGKLVVKYLPSAATAAGAAVPPSMMVSARSLGQTGVAFAVVSRVNNILNDCVHMRVMRWMPPLLLFVAILAMKATGQRECVNDERLADIFCFFTYLCTHMCVLDSENSYRSFCVAVTGTD